MIHRISAWLAQTYGISADTQQNIVVSILALIIVWLLYRLLLGLVRRSTTDVRVRYSWQKALNYIAVVISILWIAQIWLGGFQNLTTYLGLVTAGIAIALRDLIVDFVGWIFILWSRPFVVGDRIQIGNVAGDVIDLRLFQFTLLEIGNWVDADQSTGRMVHVPNGRVFSQEIANYDTGFQFIWNELIIPVTLDSDWRKAKVILQNIANKHAEALSESANEQVKEASRRFMIYYTTMTPIVYTSIKDNKVLLTIRYLTEPRKRRTSANAIWEDILQVFGERDDIHLAG